MAEIHNEEGMVLQGRIEQQPSPNYELAEALIPTAQQIESDVAKLCGDIGENNQSAFPMEAANGVTPEPITVFTARRLGNDQKPVETFSIRLADRKTVEVIHNDGKVAIFQRDATNLDAPKWVKVDMEESTNSDAGLSLDELIHSKLTTLVNQTSYRDDIPLYQEVFRTYLHQYSIENVFQINYRNSDNYEKLAQPTT